ncbi:hypothetical protein GCM10022239_25940 [Leifsonia bigeumensis]|uniref:Lipoprotein n=1 Tax=Leifsonella bigeumensis TaxID=433643 RepID=A0ABP7FX80_9MICO
MLRTAAALAAVLLLAGCIPGEPVITPEPDPDATPVFASDEEALAAATEAYAKYREVLDKIFIGGATDLSQLENVATGDQLQTESDAFAEVNERGLHSSGGTTFEVQELQQYDAGASDGKSIIIVYICENVSAVDVFDQSGASIVSSTRPDTSLYEVTFDWATKMNDLLVSHKELWSDQPC